MTATFCRSSFNSCSIAGGRVRENTQSCTVEKHHFDTLYTSFDSAPLSLSLSLTYISDISVSRSWRVSDENTFVSVLQPLMIQHGAFTHLKNVRSSVIKTARDSSRSACVHINYMSTSCAHVTPRGEDIW